MRLLIYGINYSPELVGIGKYTGDMVEWFASRGHEVRVVTAPPFYPDWRIRKAYSGRRYSTEIVNTPSSPDSLPDRKRVIVVYRCPLWVPNRPSGLKRLLHLASFALSSLPVMSRQVSWKPDVVWVVQPALFCAPAAWVTARLSGAKVWLHVQDFEVDAAFDLQLLPSVGLRQLVAAVERWLMRRFDQVSTISDKMIQRLDDKGVAGGVLFPNWVDTGRIFPLAGPSPLRRNLGLPDDAVVVLYSGNMGRKQGLEVMAHAARLCLYTGAPSSSYFKKRMTFVFCGNGAGRADLEALCTGLPNVRFLDLQPTERLNDLLNVADIHLLPQRADVADLVMPSKITGMFASGRPVVATAVPSTQLAEAVAERGRVVPPGDGVALAAAIGELAGNPEERARLGQAAREYAVAHWSRDAVLSKFERGLEQVAKAGNGHSGKHVGR